LSIEEIRSCFIEDLVMIPFQLQKKWNIFFILENYL
jgi:hypothetical protein